MLSEVFHAAEIIALALLRGLVLIWARIVFEATT